jgi:hypothetical protein
MPVTSQYIQITDYALVEYIYTDETITTTQARTLRLENRYTNTYQFLNNAQAYKRTGNILDKSASKMGTDAKVWAFHDIDSPVPIIQTDNNFVLTDVTASLLSNQKYDTVRVHFLSGFTFPGLDGVITEILFNEWTPNGTNQRLFTAAANVFLKSEPNVTFSPDPIFVGDRYYDRFIEFKIPSLYSVNLDYWTSPTATNTIGYQYTFGNVGFYQTSQISINLYEINSISETNGNRYLNTGTIWNSSVNQQDEYSFVGAVVKENSEYDFIEYYPTFHGGFIEDYINLLNETGQWVVINQLTVYEQVGTGFIKTSDVTILQEENFDQPSVYRPVLRNASAIYSYSVEYVMRLVNKVNNREIVRRSTFSSTDVKKYGYQLEKINALEGFRPIKVFNKIVKTDESPAPSVSFGTPRIVTQYNYVNNYFDVNFISVDSTTEIDSTNLGQTVYPQGKNVFYMNPFDNYVKFKIFTKSKDKKQNVTLDLAANGMNVKLSFVFDDKSQIFIDPTQDINAANPGSGEVLFKVDSETSVKLLGGNARSYFIVNRTVEGDDVLMYTGKFENVELRNLSESAIQQNQQIISQLEEQIASLKQTQQALTSSIQSPSTTPAAGVTGVTGTTGTTNAGQEVANQQAAENAASTEEGIVTVTSESAGINEAITQAAGSTGGPNRLNIVELPGVTPPLESSNWSSMRPRVENPSGQEVPISTFIKKRNNDTAIGTNPDGSPNYGMPQ